MKEKKLSSDAYQWAYDRFIKDDPEMQEFLKEVKVQSEIAGRIYNIRHKLGMSREQLAQYAGLTPEVIEDLEESDYEGSWEHVLERVNQAFESWFREIILPASRMNPEDYSVSVQTG